MMSGNFITALAGTTLVKADSDHHYVYRLINGWAGRLHSLPDGRSQYVLIFLPGDLFAVKSMFLRAQPDTIIAISEIEAERVDHRKLHDAYTHDGDLATRCIWQVLEQVLEEERRLHGWVVALGQGTAEERVALLLTSFRDRLVSSGTLPTDALRYPMPLTQSQLADHVGITPVHVNRILKLFRDANLVTVRRGCVTITNLSELTCRASALLNVFGSTRAA